MTQLRFYDDNDQKPFQRIPQGQAALHVDRRFCRHKDLVRLTWLGVLVLGYATLAFADKVCPTEFFKDMPGAPAIYSGATTLIILARIGRGDIFTDWLFTGALSITLGVSIILVEPDGSAISTLSFFVLLFACGVSRIWTGTASRRLAGLWISASGWVAIVCAIGLVVGWTFGLPISLNSLLAIDVLAQGIGIVGFASTLRRIRRHAGPAA